MNQSFVLIPEITRIVCSFVDSEDLLHFALTCRLFYHESCYRLWSTLKPTSHRTLRKIKNTLDQTKRYNDYVRKFCLSAREDTHQFERLFFQAFLFPYLRELEFSNAAAQDHIVYPMIAAAKKSLRSLNLSQCYCISTNAIKPLLSVPQNQLTSLILYGCGKIDSDLLAEIIRRHNDTLQCIRLTDINMTILNAIKNCKRLNDLGLEHCSEVNLSSSAITLLFESLISHEVELTQLRLRDIESLTSDHLQIISKFKSLVHFDMSECNRVQSEGISSLANECLCLKTLLLAYQYGVTNKAIKSFLSNCYQLKHLDVSGCRLLTDHAFTPLLNRKNDNLINLQLETLNVSGLECLTSDRILEILDQVDSLKELCLGVTYNQHEADHILEALNGTDDSRFYIDIEKYYTICRVDKNSKHGKKPYPLFNHHVTRQSNTLPTLPSSSTWELPDIELV